MKYALNHIFKSQGVWLAVELATGLATGKSPEPAGWKACATSRLWAGVLLAVVLGVLNTAGASTTVTNGAAATAGTNGVTTVVAPAAADNAATNHVNVMDDSYKLAIGDQLSYRVWEDEDDPKVLPVTDSGELEVPYLGRYPAEGKTCKQLAWEIKTELEKKYYYKATVTIAVDSKPKSRGKVYLAGAVGAAGPEDISGDEVLTVSKAILRAGGLAGFADGKKVKVTRNTGDKPGEEKTIIVNVTKVLEGGKSEEDLPLQPGDFIFVPERVIRF